MGKLYLIRKTVVLDLDDIVSLLKTIIHLSQAGPKPGTKDKKGK